MPGRNQQGDYRYAYQGQEKDPETGWEAFELRMYDGRVGRWMTTDPYSQYHSPYLAMGNNPVKMIDPDGGCTGPDCPDFAGVDVNGGAQKITIPTSSTMKLLGIVPFEDLNLLYGDNFAKTFMKDLQKVMGDYYFDALNHNINDLSEVLYAEFEDYNFMNLKPSEKEELHPLLKNKTYIYDGRNIEFTEIRVEVISYSKAGDNTFSMPAGKIAITTQVNSGRKEIIDQRTGQIRKLAPTDGNVIVNPGTTNNKSTNVVPIKFNSSFRRREHPQGGLKIELYFYFEYKGGF